MMETMQMPSCCGVKFCHSFNSNNPEEVDETLYVYESEAADDVQSYIMCLLNNTQMDRLGALMKFRGWKVVNKKAHADHSSTIYLLVKNFSYRTRGFEDYECTSRIKPAGEFFKRTKKSAGKSTAKKATKKAVAKPLRKAKKDTPSRKKATRA